MRWQGALGDASRIPPARCSTNAGAPVASSHRVAVRRPMTVAARGLGNEGAGRTQRDPTWPRGQTGVPLRSMKTQFLCSDCHPLQWWGASWTSPSSCPARARAPRAPTTSWPARSVRRRGAAAVGASAVARALPGQALEQGAHATWHVRVAGRDVYADLSGWHLYLRDMTAAPGLKMHVALAAQLGPKVWGRVGGDAMSSGVAVRAATRSWGPGTVPATRGRAEAGRSRGAQTLLCSAR